MRSRTDCWAPSPSAIMAITAAMPMTMPSIVRRDLSGFARSAERATRTTSKRMTPKLAVVSDRTVTSRVAGGLLDLERDVELCTVAFDLAALECDVERRDLGHPEVAHGFRCLAQRGRRRGFPRLGARSHELDDLVDTIRHWPCLGWRSMDTASDACRVHRGIGRKA